MAHGAGAGGGSGAGRPCRKAPSGPVKDKKILWGSRQGPHLEWGGGVNVNLRE